VSSRFLAELAQQPGASIRISGGVTLISYEVWFCCPLWADRKGLQWRLVLPHSASAFPPRLLQTGQTAFGQTVMEAAIRSTGVVEPRIVSLGQSPSPGTTRFWQRSPRLGDVPEERAVKVTSHDAWRALG